ncbi:MAG: hypothetical protein ACTHOI_09805 [Sphingomicrobium sp.]
MPGMRFKGFTALMVAGSMLASSTAAAAAGIPASAQQISPWATLTVLTGGAPAAAVCGAAAATAATAQPTTGCVLPAIDTPPPVASAAPPPLPPPPVEGYGVGPLLLGLVAIAGAVAMFFAVHGHHHQNAPVSPG